jgi:8-hydroxy-5-deazaflavin:NADPH oxidoreductase
LSLESKQGNPARANRDPLQQIEPTGGNTVDVTVIGTGNMARGIGSRVLAGGHSLTVLGKDADSARAVAADLDGDGSADTGVTGDPVEGDVLVLAVYYPDARSAVEHYGEQLAGKVVVDITNPVNETYDGLVVSPDGSATDELAKLATGARFVKAFNTTFAGTLTAGEVSGHKLDVLIAGDDDEANATVAKLARDGGLNAIEVGPQKRARELEALGLLHIVLQNTLDTGYMSAIKVIA